MLEPSRFIEEIEDRYIEIDIPKDTYAFKPLLDPSIFGDSNTTKTPAKLPPRRVKLNTQPSAGQYGKLRRINAPKIDFSGFIARNLVVNGWHACSP